MRGGGLMAGPASSSVVGLLLPLLAFALAAAVALLLWLKARDRRQIAALLERLDRLEGDRPPDLPAGELPPEESTEPRPGDVVHGATVENPSGDVLHGRTTYVQRLVDGSARGHLGLADQAIVRIHRHIEENLTPQQLAHELFVSLRTLQRGLAVVLSCTPRQLILAMKMREARRLLADGQLVSQVAERLGFTNPFHFSRRFKDFYHVAPSAMKPGAGR
jgi:AraC-like DNA-binding protein